MSIKKLQRHSRSDDWQEYCTDEDVTELEATNAGLVKALEDLLGEITEMEDQGECDSGWCRDGKIAARKALKSARGES